MKNPAHPGRIIRQEFLEALGVSVAEAARRIKVSRQALSNVLNGKADLTADMALRLEKASRYATQALAAAGVNLVRRLGTVELRIKVGDHLYGRFC